MIMATSSDDNRIIYAEDESYQPILHAKRSFSAETVSSELEDILCNMELSRSHRILRATWVELKILFPLAAPAIVVYLLNFFVSISTQMFCGHLGNLELAGVSLGNNGIQGLVFGVMVWSQLIHSENALITCSCQNFLHVSITTDTSICFNP
jgi:MATE family multidrug resistance protein